MFPTIEVAPAGAVEWSLVLFALGCAGVGTLRARSGSSAAVPRRSGFLQLVAAYFGVVLAGALLVHAAFGAAALHVATYACFLVGGAVGAWWLLVPRLRELALSDTTIIAIILGCFVLGVAGARAASVLAGETVPGEGLRLAGLGLFGAALIDLAYVALVLRVTRAPISLGRVLDAGCPAIFTNVAVSRLGCLAAGCCFGRPIDHGAFGLPARWFAPTSPAGMHYRGLDVRLWPTQPLEAAVALGIALLCHWLWRRARLPAGAIAATAAIVYGVARALLEVVRADSERRLLGQWTVWQALSAALVGVGVGWFVVHAKRFDRARPLPSSLEPR